MWFQLLCWREYFTCTSLDILFFLLSRILGNVISLLFSLIGFIFTLNPDMPWKLAMSCPNYLILIHILHRITSFYPSNPVCLKERTDNFLSKYFFFTSILNPKRKQHNPAFFVLWILGQWNSLQGYCSPRQWIKSYITTLGFMLELLSLTPHEIQWILSTN